MSSLPVLLELLVVHSLAMILGFQVLSFLLSAAFLATRAGDVLFLGVIVGLEEILIAVVGFFLGFCVVNFLYI